MTSPLRIRPAESGEAEAIARLHDRVWRHSYQDIAPPEAAAALGLPVRIARWREVLGNDNSRTLVAVAEERIVGFGRCGSSDEAVYGGRGEIKQLFVDIDQARRGIGGALMGALARELSELGYDRVGLGVVEQNSAAIAFYRALGGQVLARYTDPGPVWRSENLLFGWDDLALLTRL